jgi:AcrR family transcriptional regulator
MLVAATRAPGRASRAAILDHAVRLAAAGGLGAATIGALSSRLGMSKSAVFAHFGSKPALDLAVVDAAAARFHHHVSAPAATAPSGVARLVASAEAWLDGVAGDDPALAVLSGATLPARGDVRDALVRWRGAWRTALAAEIAAAIDAGELDRAAPVDVVAFEVDAVLQTARHDHEAGDGGAVGRARYAIELLLGRWAAADPRP